MKINGQPDLDKYRDWQPAADELPATRRRLLIPHGAFVVALALTGAGFMVWAMGVLPALMQGAGYAVGLSVALGVLIAMFGLAATFAALVDVTKGE